MLRVGLTGGTGAGKSTVARLLADLGAVVVDADALAREVVAPGSEGLAAVAAEFGPQVLAADGSLDRAALASVVFADPDRRRALEQITHPRIAARTGELVAAAPADAVVVHDVPLLVEKHMGPGYHLVVVVHADEQERVRRLVASGRMGEDDARARVRAQATDEQRRAAADVLLDNTRDAAALEADVHRLWRERLVPFERNLREGVPAGRPERVSLVPADPTWPAQATRVLERVALAAGDAALSLEHVGSTSVPGLDAKDVIDVQLVVADLDAADALRGPLTAAGFAPYPGQWWDEAPDGGRPAKRLHGACDPLRPVNLHLRPADSPAVPATLAFRDWLRAHPDEAAAYAEVKHRAAGVPVEQYVEAKGPWVRDGIRRAGEWVAAGRP